ncbi:MG2 domain-containing protein [Treponema parvum]|uniref:alpha-2-macroglobulin family protein n=1 Tax=Treponema parvum TaxID=138851 RepID=UPI001AEBCD0D|nr:MG2 domain-containing protein [Treponema parvum]QTQ16510.1 alpha-2-macroglobulin [Treponema parvum]
MKKNMLVPLSAAMLVFVLFFAAGCSKNNAEARQSEQTRSDEDGGDFAYIPDFEQAFIPVYEKTEPEPDRPAKKRNVGGQSAAAGKKSASGVSSSAARGGASGTTSSTVRPLKEYKTAYTTTRPAQSALSIPAGVSGYVLPAAEEKGDLTVADWGPQKELPATIRQPSFYVVFSLPVKAISALEEPSSKSEYMRVEPAVEGVFRWYGSRHLAFEASENINPLQEYTITVPDTVKSLSGKPITGERVFKIKSEELRITGFNVGYSFAKKTGMWIDTDDVVPEAANEVLLVFNYPVKAQDFASRIRAEVDGSVLPCTISQKDDKSLLVTVKGNIPFDTDVYIYVDKLSVRYHTLLPFQLEDIDVERSAGRFLNPVYLRFSHDVEASSVSANLSTEPAMPITKENIEVNGGTVIVYGLPVSFNSKYTLTVKDGIKDVYGRKLRAGKSVSIRVPEAASYVRFLDSGTKMLEAAYPHKFLFEYQNLYEPSRYSVVKTDNPLAITSWEAYISDKNAAEPNIKIRNQRQFEVIDLDPLLDNGKGFVRFDAEMTVPSYWDKGKFYTQENCTTIQVTDLGVTVRYGINKAVVLVTSLATGNPVEGANVYMYNGESSVNTAAATALGSGTTDKNGLAVLRFGSSSAAFFNGNREAVYVEKAGDRAVFYPNTHREWRSVSSVDDIDTGVQAFQRTFMFSDRGLYRPGETITFRGIDRTQRLGSFTPYTGDYTVTLKENVWGDAEEVAHLSGTCSESGGFWGSVALPENVKPGQYVLIYERPGSKRESRRINITIAYFERVKFQAEVALSDATLVAGDTISGSVKASYLSGGSLAEATYTGGWVRQGCDFTSDDPALKNYTFGPREIERSMEQLSSFEGRLSADGSARISYTTAEEGIVGSPYRYFAEASVTDVSNQLIAARGAVTVHPASFYIGVAKPDGIAGFAKKGQELNFPLMLASADGKALASLDFVKGNLSAELIRDDWHLVQQYGSAGSVYASYEKESVTEYTVSVKPSLKGSVKVTPKNAGYYTLVLSGTDRNGKTAKTEYSFFVTGSGAVFWNRDFESSLRLTPDQSQYNPGDTARILLESPLPAGNYLITVEREGIFTEQVRRFEESTAVLEIPIALNYVPVVYVSVCSYSVRSGKPTHRYGEADMDKPKGFFGSTAVFVNPRVKAFSIDVAADKPSYRPGEKAVIVLNATKGGKPLADAELTLMAVDRGVLDLINYHVPNPVDFFYNEYNFPLCVKGGDSRSLLMDPVTYEIKNLKGGDASDEEKEQGRKKFDPTAVFIPVLKTDKNGQARAEFTLPDTLTTYRITAFGVHDDLLALQEDEMLVQNPVNVLAVKPRRLRERDTAECGVLISNLDSRSHSITVKAEVRSVQNADPANGGKKPGKAFFDGSAQKTVKVESGAQATVYFDLAAQKAGEVEVVFSVSSDILKERLVQPLVIEHPFVFETFTSTGTVERSASSTSEAVALPSFADLNAGSLSVTLDASRLATLSSAVNYVFNYPYGCMEQQSARLLPLVVFGDYIGTFGLKTEVPDVKKTVKETFASWKQIQLDDGGFPYWPEGTRSSFYVSLRIAHLCALAKERGYGSADIALNTERLASFIASSLYKDGTPSSGYLRAYACYVLALNGRSFPASWLPGTADKDTDISVSALAGLACLERNSAGDREKAQQYAQVIRRYLRPDTRGVDITSPDESRYWYWYANDKSMDYALTVKLFTLLNADDDMITKLLYTLLQRQKAGYWKSTAVTTFVLDSVYTVIKTSKLDNLNMSASASVDGKELVSGSFKGAGAQALTFTADFDEEPLSTLKRDTLLPLTFTKKGSNPLYYTTSLKYAIPQEMQTSRDEGLGVSYVIRDAQTDKIVKPSSASSSLIELESGKTYEMEIKLSSGRDRTFVALRAPVPSGAEIIDAAFVTTASLTGSNRAEDEEDDDEDDWYSWFYGRAMSSQRIYDNEVQYFWNDWAKGSDAVRFKFRAVRKGVYPCPPLTAECMYENEIFGRTDGYLFVIK